MPFFDTLEGNEVWIPFHAVKFALADETGLQTNICIGTNVLATPKGPMPVPHFLAVRGGLRTTIAALAKELQ